MPESSPIPGSPRPRPTPDNSNIRDPWIDARFEPDLMLPVQFNDMIRRRWQMDGEMRLVLAVLEDAVRTYVKAAASQTRRGGKRFLEVCNWFDSKARYPFSFEYTCEILGMPAEALRKRLSTFTAKDFPTKQVHSVGRRQLMRPQRYSPRRRSRTRAPRSSRLASETIENTSLTAAALQVFEQVD
jgi:hypothetical protein